MVDLKLVEIIKSRLSQGANINLIRRQLFLQGYKPPQIEEAIKALNEKKEKKIFRLPIKLNSKLPLKYLIIILSAILILLVIIFGLFYVIKNSSSVTTIEPKSNSLNSLKIIKINKLIQNESSLDFSYIFSSPLEKQEVTLKKEILDSKKNPIPGLFQESAITIISGEEMQDSIDISSLSNDRYTLKLTLKYNNRISTASELFRILKTTNTPYSNGSLIDNFPSEQIITCSSNSSDSCNDDDLCTKDECIFGICTFTDIPQCCGNFICEGEETQSSCKEDCQTFTISPDKTDTDLIADAESQAQHSLARSSKICSSLSIDYNKDVCFASIASITQRSKFCSQINDTTYRDDCYLILTSSKNNLCSKINDLIKKTTCEYLP